MTYIFAPRNRLGNAKPFVFDLNDPAGRSMYDLFHKTKDCTFSSLNGLTGFYLNRNRVQENGSVLLKSYFTDKVGIEKLSGSDVLNNGRRVTCNFLPSNLTVL